MLEGGIQTRRAPALEGLEERIDNGADLIRRQLKPAVGLVISRGRFWQVA